MVAEQRRATAGTYPPSNRGAERRLPPVERRGLLYVHLGQSSDDLPVLILCESAERLRAAVALRGDTERELHDGFIVRRLRDDNRVVLASHEVEVLNLGAQGLKRLFRRVQPGGSLLDGLHAFLGESDQGDICGCGHRGSSFHLL